MADATAENLCVDGFLSLKGVAEFLDVSEATARTIARQERWPRKRLKGTSNVRYPRALVVKYATECEDVGPVT